MRDYGTRPVEPVWIAPLRKYAPAVLVLCIALLLALAVIPLVGAQANPTSITAVLLLGIVYLALAALGAYLFIAAREIESTTRSELEHAVELYELNERLNTTLRSIGDGVISTDVDGVVTLANDVACQMTGWPASRAIGAKADDLFHVVNERTREPEEHPSRMVLAVGRNIRQDEGALLVARDGTERPIAYNAAPILDADGWIMGAVIVFHDVTGLREAERQREQLIGELSAANEKLLAEVSQREEARRAALNLMQDAQLAQSALRESEERLRVLFEGIDDSLFVHDATGRILDCNQAACAALGYSRAELLTRKLSEISPEPPETSPARRLVTRDGRSIPVHVHTSVIRYHGAEVLLTLARDIAELTKAQDELRASNERLRESNLALEEYAHVASHDLQEPLRKIESFAQVLVEDCGDRLDEKGRLYLNIMVDAANRMRRLIRDVLAFSRAGRQEKPPAPVDLNRVLEVVVRDNLAGRIQDRRAAVEAKNLPTVFADETQMIQLFQNLVGNGLKFNKVDRPRVEVYAEAVGGRNEWKVFVRDNGIGMRPDECETIFAPFRRLHSQQQYEGTGIGLAICRRIVVRHGGTIGVQSEPGKGSTFWLTLPGVPPAEDVRPREPARATDTRKGDIHEPSNA